MQTRQRSLLDWGIGDKIESLTLNLASERSHYVKIIIKQRAKAR